MPKTTYIGFYYEDELPLKDGDKVVIPKGVKVRSFNPSKKDYVTKQKTTVVARIGNGSADPKDGDSTHVLMHALSNPTVTWAGSGGYWCSVDLNDILDANGFEGPAEQREQQYLVSRRYRGGFRS